MVTRFIPALVLATATTFAAAPVASVPAAAQEAITLERIGAVRMAPPEEVRGGDAPAMALRAAPGTIAARDGQAGPR